MTIGGDPFIFAAGITVRAEANADIGLSAAAGTGYAFSRWEGDGASLSGTISMTLNDNVTSAVVFVDAVTEGASFMLTVNITGAGSAVLTIGGNEYTLTAATTVIRLENGLTVELEYLPPVVLFGAFMAPEEGITATAAVSDYSFSRWEGSGASLSMAISLIMDAPKTSTLVLVDVVTPGESFALTVNTEGTGTVTAAINGFIYTLEESTVITLEKSIVVSLTANAADAAHAFSRWEGDGASLSSTTSVTMSADRTSTAVFVDVAAAGSSFVTVNIAGNGEVVVTINGNDYRLSAASTKVWIEGASVSLAFDAVSKPAAVFSHWADGNGSVYVIDTHSASVTDGYSITAYFYAGTGWGGDGSYRVTVNIEGDGTVGVTFTDQDGNVVTFTDVTGLILVYGTTVIFTANSGSEPFLQWTDDEGTVLSTETAFSMTIEGSFDITASFRSTPSGGGLSMTVIALLAVAAAGAVGAVAYLVMRGKAKGEPKPPKPSKRSQR